MSVQQPQRYDFSQPAPDGPWMINGTLPITTQDVQGGRLSTVTDQQGRMFRLDNLQWTSGRPGDASGGTCTLVPYTPPPAMSPHMTAGPPPPAFQPDMMTDEAEAPRRTFHYSSKPGVGDPLLPDMAQQPFQPPMMTAQPPQYPPPPPRQQPFATGQGPGIGIPAILGYAYARDGAAYWVLHNVVGSRSWQPVKSDFTVGTAVQGPGLNNWGTISNANIGKDILVKVTGRTGTVVGTVNLQTGGAIQQPWKLGLCPPPPPPPPPPHVDYGRKVSAPLDRIVQKMGGTPKPAKIWAAIVGFPGTAVGVIVGFFVGLVTGIGMAIKNHNPKEIWENIKDFVLGFGAWGGFLSGTGTIAFFINAGITGAINKRKAAGILEGELPR